MLSASGGNVRKTACLENVVRLPERSDIGPSANEPLVRSDKNVNIKILRPHLQLELVPDECKITHHLTYKMTNVLHNGQLQLFFVVLFSQLQKLQVVLVLDSQFSLAKTTTGRLAEGPSLKVRAERLH